MQSRCNIERQIQRRKYLIYYYERQIQRHKYLIYYYTVQAQHAIHVQISFSLFVEWR